MAKNTGGNLDYRKFKIANDEVDYRIKFSNYNDVQLTDLGNMIISENKNETFKINDVMTFTEQKVLSSINREDQQYIRYISFEFKGPYKYGQNYLEASIASLPVPIGYSTKPAEFNFFLSEKDEIDILKVFGAAVLIIFMITASFFESFKKPIIILTAIPFALIGAVFFFWLFDFNIERGAYAGMLLLIGLCISNSIVLINYLSANCRSFSVEEIINLSKTRLRAILTTTLTTFAALIPFIISNESDFWKNLSLTISGGIIISSLYIIMFMPMIFKLLAPRNKINTMR